MKDWALILGASSGIGKECAKRLAKNGVNIYGLYLRKRKNEIDSLIEELSNFGVKVIYKKANASNDISRKEIIQNLNNEGDIRIKMFIHSIAFGTLKKMIGDRGVLLKSCLRSSVITSTCGRFDRADLGPWPCPRYARTRRGNLSRRG